MPEKITIPVGGMTCRHCADSVAGALAKLPGATKVEVSLERGEAVVSGKDLDVQVLRNAIEDLGFDAGETAR